MYIYISHTYQEYCNNVEIVQINVARIPLWMSLTNILSFWTMVLIEDGTICLRSSDPFYIVNYYIKWATTSWTHSSSVKDAHMWSIICNIICLSHSFIMPTVLKSKFSCFKEGTCATCSEQPYSLITMLRTLTYILTFKVEFLLICCIYKKNENITLLNSTAVLMCHFVRLSVPVEIVLLAFSLSHSRWFLLLFSAVL